MKKVFVLLLIFSLFLIGGCTSNNTIGEEDVSIQKLSIQTASEKINAGESFEFDLYVNNNKSNFNDIMNIQFVFSKGWDNAEFKNGRIYIRSDAKDESIIEFYVKSGSVTSNTLQIIIINEEEAKQQLILEYEKKISEIEKQIQQYYKEKAELQTQFNNAENDYYNYDSYCQMNGYLTAYGDWKVSSSSPIRIQHDKFYATMNESYSRLLDKEAQIVNAQSDISNYRKKIQELQ